MITVRRARTEQQIRKVLDHPGRPTANTALPGRGQRVISRPPALCCMAERAGRTLPFSVSVSRDPNILRASQIEQGADLGRVAGITTGQCGRHDLPGVGVRADVQRAPGPACLGSVLFKQSLPFAGIPLAPRAEP